MSKYNGKSIAVSTVLKMKGPFKVAHITELSGLDRQLSYYHVNKMLEDGMLIRTGQAYSIVDRDALLDYLVQADEAPGLRPMQPAGLFSEGTTTNLNDIVLGLIAAKVLVLPDAIDMTVHMNKILDDTIAEIRVLKRYLNNSQLGRKKATQYYISSDNKKKNLHIWDIIVGDYGFEPTEEKKVWEYEIGERA